LLFSDSPKTKERQNQGIPPKFGDYGGILSASSWLALVAFRRIGVVYPRSWQSAVWGESIPPESRASIPPKLLGAGIALSSPSCPSSWTSGAVYGCDPAMSDEEILAKLLELNLQRKAVK